MESSPAAPDDPRSVLAVADEARQRMTAALRLPTGLFPALAAAVAVQIGTGGFGIAQQTAAGMAVLFAGSAVFLLVAALALHQFRRINGVSVDGLGSQIVLGTGTLSSTAYVGAFAAATWAAFESLWWLVALAAVVGGVGYALGVRQWWQAYRRDPVAHAGGASPLMLAAFAVVACVGLVALLVAA